eukprot:scaffold137616_cov151-Phaeocystis_antarctica.AAC.1
MPFGPHSTAFDRSGAVRAAGFDRPVRCVVEKAAEEAVRSVQFSRRIGPLSRSNGSAPRAESRGSHWALGSNPTGSKGD